MMTGKPRTAAFVIFSVMLAIAAGAFVKASQKAMSANGSEDFATLYSAARAWRTGVNPYATSSLVPVWLRAGGPPLMGPNYYFELSLYPPSTLVAMSPWSIFDWPVARRAWAVTNVLLVLGALVGVLDMAGVSWPDWRVPAVLAMTLALGSFRNTVSFGQPAAPACAAILIAAALARRRQDVAAALLLALALAIKVQIAGPFLAYYFCRKRWTLFGISTAAFAALMLIGLLRMKVAGYSWVDDWMNNIKLVGAPGGINDCGPSGPWRFQLVNLQVILSTLVSRSIANAITVAVVGIITAGVLLRVWLRKTEVDRRIELAELSLMSALALLALYHRWYDTGTLAFVFAWAAVTWGSTGHAASKAKELAVAGVALVVPFFLSLAIKLTPDIRLQRTSFNVFVPATAAKPGPWWMDLVVLPNQVWALILLVVLMIYVTSKSPSRE